MFVYLPVSCDRKSVFRHVLDYCRACRNVGVFSDPDGGNDVRAAADKRAVADNGAVLVPAVKVDRGATAAKVDILADIAVADISQMRNFRFVADDRIFQLYEVADSCVVADGAVGPDPDKWPDLCIVPDL